jgi:4-amino-4-deoxy-L-arabinose transferase-like glycosyltransferase
MPKKPRQPVASKAFARLAKLLAWRYCDLALVGLLVVAVTAVNYWWASTDARPPDWDAARDLWNSLLYLQTLHTHRLLPFLQQYDYYPPLVYWVALPFYKLFGISITSAVLSNAVFITPLLYAVYFLGRRLGGRSVGLLATLLIASYPMMVSQFKQYQLDAPLAAMVALALCLLVYSQGFRRPRLTLAFGVVCGLGMLTKWTFVACIALPALWTLGQAVVADIKARAPRRLATVGVAALIAYTICSPWYAANFQQFQIDMQANGKPQAILEGDPQVGTWAGDTYYLNSLVNEQIFLPGVLFFLIGLGVIAWRRPRENGIPELLLLIAGSYIVFTVIANKDARYTLPMLPAVAVISAYGLLSLSKRGRLAVSAAVGVYCVVVFSAISFGTTLLPSSLTVRLGAQPLTLFAQHGYIIGPPQRQDWGLSTVMALVSRQAPQQRTLSYSGPDTIWFNSWDLTYYGQLDNVTITGKSAYQIVRTSRPPSQGGAILRRTLPDGTILSLYHR